MQTNFSLVKEYTLYAGFEKQDVDSVLPEYTELSIGTDDIYYEIRFESDAPIDERNLASFLTVTALYGEVPRFSVEPAPDGGYILSPVGGYENGGVYQIAIEDNSVSFTKLDAAHGDDYTDDRAIRTVYLSVDAAEEKVATVRSDILEINRSAVTFSESESKFTAAKTILERIPLTKGAVVHLTGGDDTYIRITDIQAVGETYEFSFADCESVDDVWEDFNLNVSDITVANKKTLVENQSLTQAELDAVVNALYTGKGTEALTGMLANALNASPTLYALTNTSENPYRDRITDKSGKKFTIEGLLENLEIQVSLGTARNPNFNGIAIPRLTIPNGRCLRSPSHTKPKSKTRSVWKQRSPLRSTCMWDLPQAQTNQAAISKSRLRRSRKPTFSSRSSSAR